MQQAQSRARSRRWIGRGALVSPAALVAFGVQPAVPALAGSWSAPVPLPGSCGSSVAVNQAGAMVAGGTFTAADGSRHVQVCTSPDGMTWQAVDLGPGGDEPQGGQHPVVALSPDGHAVAVWGGSTVGVQAAVRPPGDGWTTPVTLTGDLNGVSGGIVLGWTAPATRSLPGPGSTPAPATTPFCRPAAATLARCRRCRTATPRARRTIWAWR